MNLETYEIDTLKSIFLRIPPEKLSSTLDLLLQVIGTHQDTESRTLHERYKSLTNDKTHRKRVGV